MTPPEFTYVGLGELRVRLAHGTLIVPGERLVRGDVHFQADPVTDWLWEDGHVVAASDRSRVATEVQDRAARAGIILEIDPPRSQPPGHASWPPGTLTFKGLDSLLYEGEHGTVVVPGHLRFERGVPHFAVAPGATWVWLDGGEVPPIQQAILRRNLHAMATARGVVIEGR